MNEKVHVRGRDVLKRNNENMGIPQFEVIVLSVTVFLSKNFKDFITLKTLN